MIFGTVYPWVQDLFDTFNALPLPARDIIRFIVVVTLILVFWKAWSGLCK